MERNNNIYFESNISDVLFQLKTKSNLQVCGGCTYLRELPPVALVVRNVGEFKIIEKRERYIELGSGLTLSSVIEVGEKNFPPVFFEALRMTATPLVRNVATLGGNVCLPGVKGTLFAPLLALDAMLEFKNASESFLLPISQFSSVPPGSILSKVRIPLGEWDTSLFRRVGPPWRLDANCASFAFLADTNKGSLSNLRIAFCGVICLRSKDLENMLIGKSLPLSCEEISDILTFAGEYFDQQVEQFLLEGACPPNGDSVASQEYPAGRRHQNVPTEKDLALLKARFLGVLRQSLNLLT